MYKFYESQFQETRLYGNFNLLIKQEKDGIMLVRVLVL